MIGCFNKDKYKNKIKIIKNLILKKYINNEFKFIENKESLLITIIIDNSSSITILPDNNWNDIKRHIDRKIKGANKNCLICCNKVKIKVSCNKCSQDYCSECYINLFKVGKGIIVCPFCKYSFGIRMSEYMVQNGINNIRKALKKQ